LKATFPHLAHLNVVLEVLYPALGIEVIPPPPITKKTIEIGVKLAPQNACFPMKVTLGNFIEGIEKGADTIFMAGGVGPCRFGYYGQIQRIIIEDLGYDVNFVLIDSPRYGWKNFFSSLKTMVGGKWSISRIHRAVRLAWNVLRYVEDLEKTSRLVRWKLKEPSQLDGLMEKSLKEIKNITSVAQLEEIRSNALHEISQLNTIEKNEPIKIGIVGEVYIAQEFRVNFNIEKLLGNMGILVDNSVSTAEYVLNFFPLTRSREKEEAWKLAKPFLKRFVGGEGIDTVGSTIRYSQQGFDGVIHLYPFTCMPEAVAKSVVAGVGREYNIPILHLAIDEHAGEAGMITRVEAFVDVLEMRRQQNVREASCS
jgi:predicted nucleotide-binding protein (sugar kinase/HSP70/actin superfamily)